MEQPDGQQGRHHGGTEGEAGQGAEDSGQASRKAGAGGAKSTAWERFETALTESDERLRMLMDSLPVAVAIAEDAECKVITMNPACEQMFGIEAGRDDPPPSPDLRIAARRYYAGNRELKRSELPMQVAVTQNRPVRNAEITVRMPDGTHRIVLINATPLHDRAGKPAGGIAVALDITDLKRAEAEIRRHAEELRTANKELSQFNHLAVDRELRMIELKKEVNSLCTKLGQPAPYRVEHDEPGTGGHPAAPDSPPNGAPGYYQHLILRSLPPPPK